MHLAIFFGSFFILIIHVTCNAAGIIKCKDFTGKVVYTQSQSDCSGNIELKEVEVSSRSALSAKAKVSYRTPQREYVREKGKWDIHVEAALLKGDPVLYRSSLNKLNVVLDDIFSILPLRPSQELSDLTIFLMWGKNSPDGGRKSGMSYIRKGEPANYSYLDPGWEHSLVIYSAENLMYLNNLWSRKAIVHELSHAWHITNWPERHPPIYGPWIRTQQSNRYQNVQDIKGKTIKNAYARKNQLEYFAELSAIYFVGGNYYPYNRKRLEMYDPEGYGMVKTLWH